MDSKGALEGVKVVDFGWVGAGPMTARELAFNGATVIRVESHKSIDILRECPPYRGFQPQLNMSGIYATFNSNKYGISLDMSKPRGYEVAKRLVLWADVVMQSMTPGTMAKLGLDYDGCRKIKPDIIYCATTQFGQSGSLSKAIGFGVHGASYAGLSHILGWPDRSPLYNYNYIPNHLSPYHAVACIIGALIRHRKTGEGMCIDQSQVEVGVSALGVSLLDYIVNKRIAGRLGNRDPYATPHGVYPCRGNDCWLAIAVTTEREWVLFGEIVGGWWCRDAKFSTLALRKRNEDELDKLVAAWTLTCTAEQAMQRLLDAGIPAGVVETAEDLFNNPQLKSREHFKFLEHKEMGCCVYHSPAYRLPKTPVSVWKASPCLGEDNFCVYKDILGFSEDEISDLLAEGVITTDADVGEIKSVR